MHAFLLVGRNEQSLDNQLKALQKRHGFGVLERQIKKIDDVRDLNSFTKLSLKSPTCILIKDIDKATNEALNAFLKNLEEPQKNLYFILTASSKYAVLPTIFSRCQIIRLQPDNDYKVSKEVQKYFRAKPPEKLALVSQIKSRQEAIEFIQDFIYLTHQLLRKKADKKLLANYASQAQKTLTALNKNANPTLQLTRFTVNLID